MHFSLIELSYGLKMCSNLIKKSHDAGKPAKKGYSFCPAPWKAGSKSFMDTDILDVTEESSPDFVSKQYHHYPQKMIMIETHAEVRIKFLFFI